MKKFVCLLLCIVMIFGIIILPAAAAEPKKSSVTLADCNAKKIGVLTGSIHDTYAKEHFPDAELEYFSSVGDMVTAVSSGSIDTFSNDILSAYSLLAEHPEFAYIDEPLDYIRTAFAFAKSKEGTELCGEMNAFLSKLEKDGTLSELQDKWLRYDSGDYDVDISDLKGNDRTIVFATSCSGKPNAYYYNNAPTGYEVELAAMFCRERGYNLDIEVTDFAGIIPGIVSGKYDIGADGIAVTEERSKSVNFSTPDYNCPIVMIIKADEKEKTDSDLRYFTSLDELLNSNPRFGIFTGMSTEKYYAELAPDAELKYYNGMADLLYALSIGQIDGTIDDEPLCKYLSTTTDGVTYLDEPIGDELETAFVMGKTDFAERVKRDLNEYIVKNRDDGTIAEIVDAWCGPGNDKLTVSIPTEGKNGTVRAALCSQSVPANFVKDGEYAGFEVDIISRFCTEYGYALEITDMDFGGLINAVESGRFDIGFSYVSITEERKETVNFTEPYMSSTLLMLVREPAAEKGFLDKVAFSFERTFIKESRWKLIVQGIETTLIISVGAALLGTVLGFGLCLLRRMKNPVIHGFTTVYIRLLQGTPILVLLMILYYIVFAKSGVSGVLVAILAFALNFAAYVCEMFRTGIESVDIGQTEAALAIGFTKRQTFFRIVMPQAAQNFLPVYKGEFISLVKMTSVVGYIAVQDLTKMSDIIRSRTYDAFFPLISTAVIYFLLATLLTLLLRAVEIKAEPDRKNRTVKGVKMQ